MRSRYLSGGTESHTFNKLEETALSSVYHPSTPVFGCKLTQALNPQYVKSEVCKINNFTMSYMCILHVYTVKYFSLFYSIFIFNSYFTASGSASFIAGDLAHSLALGLSRF